MSENNNLLGLLKVWIKWRKTIVVVCMLAGIGTAGISLLLSNYYQSFTVFYAASSDLFKPDKIFGYGSESMYYYGSAEDIDRVLSIAESQELMEYMLVKFNLYQHYKVDSTTNKGRFLLQEIFKSQYKVQKNKYDAIELSVEDTDPIVAQQMTKAAREKIDLMARTMIKNSQYKIVDAFSTGLKDKNTQLAQLEDSLRTLRSNYGIYNSDTQSKMLTDLSAIAAARLSRTQAQVAALEKEPAASQDTIIMLRALAKGLTQEVAAIKNGSNGTNAFNKGVGTIDVLTQQHLQTRNQLSYDMVRMQQMKSALKSDVSAIYLVEDARVPLIKSRPKRMILVIAALLAAFIFATIGVILLENYRNIDWSSLKEN